MPVNPNVPNPIVVHQAYLPLPQLGVEFVNDNRTIHQAWYRVIVAFYQRLGAKFVEQANYITMCFAGPGATIPIQAVNSQTGAILGPIPTDTQMGAAPLPIAVGDSPFEYQTNLAGVYIVNGAQVEFSRDGSTWYYVSPMGGMLPVRYGDFIRLTYFGAAPEFTFLPNVTWTN